jgi:hypothetical protein
MISSEKVTGLKDITLKGSFINLFALSVPNLKEELSAIVELLDLRVNSDLHRAIVHAFMEVAC